MTHTLFAGIHLVTAPGEVMTPRPATEALVETATKRIGEAAGRVADVGTGSGAIAVTVALRSPRARVWATDSNAAAVALARANVSRHGVGDRVTVLHADLLNGVPDGLDLVAANLPYLSQSLRPARPELAREPADAVFAPGDGLGPYRRLIEAAAAKLRPDGIVAIQLHRRVVVCEDLDCFDLAA